MVSLFGGREAFATLCTVGCLVAPLTRMHQIPVVTPKYISSHCQMSLGGTEEREEGGTE